MNAQSNDSESRTFCIRITMRGAITGSPAFEAPHQFWDPEPEGAHRSWDSGGLCPQSLLLPDPESQGFPLNRSQFSARCPSPLCGTALSSLHKPPVRLREHVDQNRSGVRPDIGLLRAEDQVLD